MVGFPVFSFCSADGSSTIYSCALAFMDFVCRAIFRASVVRVDLG
jgi:hypothetical protein